MRRITPAEAGKLMGVSAEFIRVGLQTGRLPIGTAFRKPGSSRWRYYISPEMLTRFTGKEIEDVDGD